MRLNIDRFFVDAACNRVNCEGERICGDSFLIERLDGGNRTIIVLSDGLGHGVKANVLSTLTSTMLLNFLRKSEDIHRISSMILKTLPVCSVRKFTYSTFTFIDIDHTDGLVTIVEYDNPAAFLFRGSEPLKTERTADVVKAEGGREQVIYTSKTKMMEGDRVIFMSDGITESGQGREGMSFGWGVKGVEAMLGQMLRESSECTSDELSHQILKQALINDGMKPHDDMSCIAIWLRKPKKVTLASCPPSSTDRYAMLTERVMGAEGQKVVCGYPAAKIISSQLGIKLEQQQSSFLPDTPPAWRIEGIDLVTEGIITLNRVCDILENNQFVVRTNVARTGVSGSALRCESGVKKEAQEIAPAVRLCNILTGSDHIDILIGNKRQITHSVYIPDEFDLRRRVLKRIANILENKYMKLVTVEYI